MTVKLVIFDLGGVVISTPYYRIQEYLWEIGLPGEFVQEIFVFKDSSHPLAKAFTGQLSLSQFYPELDKYCKKVATEKGIEISSINFSGKDMFDKFWSGLKVIPEMLNASAVLRKEGIKTCILTNDFLIDISFSGIANKAADLTSVRYHFDEVFRSCQLHLKKPDPEIYNLVCTKMGVQPSETVFLDDLAINLKPAKELGMTTILVKNPHSALCILKDVTGVDVSPPTAMCSTLYSRGGTSLLYQPQDWNSDALC